MSERPCKNCQQIKNDHTTIHYKCDVDRLPLPFQEMWYNCQGQMVIPNYEPMENLEYLEYLSGQK